MARNLILHLFTYLILDYAKGVITEIQQVYSDENNQIYVEITNSHQEIDGIWVLSASMTQITNFATEEQYVINESYSNVIINSGIPDSIFQ